MNDVPTTREIDSRALRAQRGAAAVVAQYIHELSDRHAQGRAAGDRRQQPGSQTYAKDLLTQDAGEALGAAKR